MDLPYENILKIKTKAIVCPVAKCASNITRGEVPEWEWFNVPLFKWWMNRSKIKETYVQ